MRVSKGPRLWLQPGFVGGDGRERAAVWYILDDGGIKRSTGCGAQDRRGAEERLSSYLDAKRAAERPRDRRADQVLIADVLHIYLTDKAPSQPRPAEVAARITRLLT